MENLNEVMDKVREARRQHRDSLNGVDRMQYNFLMKHRGWMLRNDDRHCVTVGDVVERVMMNAPNTIVVSREEVARAIESLWAVTHDYSIADDNCLREDMEEELSYHFQ